jgi:hypothetical protein
MAASKNPGYATRSLHLDHAQQWLLAIVAHGAGRTIESLSQEFGNMSSIGKATAPECPRVETEFSPFVRPKNGLLTHAVESEDFAEFVRELSKSTWFCEVAEA